MCFVSLSIKPDSHCHFRNHSPETISSSEIKAGAEVLNPQWYSQHLLFREPCFETLEELFWGWNSTAPRESSLPFYKAQIKDGNIILYNNGDQFVRRHTTPSSYTLRPHIAGHTIASIQFLHQSIHGVKFSTYYKVSPARKDAALLANMSRL